MQDLHEFPYFETTEQGTTLEELKEKISCKFSLKVHLIKPLPMVRHSFTKYRVRLTPYLFNSAGRKPLSGYSWFSLQELERLPFSSGHRKILAAL